MKEMRIQCILFFPKSQWGRDGEAVDVGREAEDGSRETEDGRLKRRGAD